MRGAKIVCTLGPASESLRTIESLVNAGMDVARINASHTDADGIADLAEAVRTVDGRVDTHVATVLDLQGPEVRTRPGETLELAAEETVTLRPDVDTASGEIGLSRSIARVRPGDRVLIDDGRIELVVTAVESDVVSTRVENGGRLDGRQGLNIPGVDLDLPMVTAKDRADLEMLRAGTIDFVAASFVRDASDLLEVSEAIEARDADAPIIAKIERADAVDNLAEIIEAAHGIMVARGDLGVECPMEDVPMIQKRIIHACQRSGTPVITATEMLDSMVTASRPTRAEASDVANAVLDGTDALMLSEETAIGDHPVRVVETMDRIIREVERSEEHADLREQRVPATPASRTGALARSGRYLARDVGASAMIVTSETGYTARKVAKFRPGVPVVAATLSAEVARQLAISWGLGPHRLEPDEPTAQELVSEAVASALEAGIAESGDTVVVLVGMMREIEGGEFTNTLKVHVAAETLVTGRVVVRGRASGPIARVSDGDLRSVPTGAIIAIPHDFSGEFSGDPSSLGGIVHGAEGLTGYAAMIAREMEIPMISGAPVPSDVEEGAEVTLDAERGVLYAGNIARPHGADRDSSGERIS